MDKIPIMEGIKFMQLAPEKHHRKNKSIQMSETTEPDDLEQMTFERKMARRKRDEEKGLVEPAEVVFTREGKKFVRANQMSQQEYKRKHSTFGTIGKIEMS